MKLKGNKRKLKGKIKGNERKRKEVEANMKKTTWNERNWKENWKRKEMRGKET